MLNLVIFGMLGPNTLTNSDIFHLTQIKFQSDTTRAGIGYYSTCNNTCFFRFEISGVFFSTAGIITRDIGLASISLCLCSRMFFRFPVFRTPRDKRLHLCLPGSLASGAIVSCFLFYRSYTRKFAIVGMVQARACQV